MYYATETIKKFSRSDVDQTARLMTLYDSEHIYISSSNFSGIPGYDGCIIMYTRDEDGFMDQRIMQVPEDVIAIVCERFPIQTIEESF